MEINEHFAKRMAKKGMGGGVAEESALEEEELNFQ